MLPALKNVEFNKDFDKGNFFLIAGPCITESKEIVYSIAEKVKNITEKLKIPYIFKASYRKANRTKLDSFSGIGDTAALKILKSVKDYLKIPVLTDIHSVEEGEIAAQYVDILQIPAFLCRQTDILIAAAKTGKVVNIKKGQFLSPESMKFASDKVLSTGKDKIILTERGSFFGYNDLVIDFRGISEMKKFGFPVVLDITHSLQQPNLSTGVTGGKPEMIETIARAGIATGTDGLFIETHPDPSNAKSDGANMLPLDKLEGLLTKLVQIREVVNKL